MSIIIITGLCLGGLSGMVVGIIYRKKFNGMVTLVLLMGLIFFCYWIFDIVNRIGGHFDIPRRQLVRPDDNVCVGFAPSIGSGEFAYMFSIDCNETGPLTEPWDVGVTNSAITTECPIITVLSQLYYKGSRIIYIEQDWLCKAFAHNYPPDDKVQAWVINEAGQFVKILGAEPNDF